MQNDLPLKHKMWANPNLLVNKKPNVEKLRQYGFAAKGEEYVFTKDILNQTFRLEIIVAASGDTRFEAVDKATEETYDLIFNPSAVGSFVGKVRAECEKVLSDIVATCYETEVFKSAFAKLVISYLRDKYKVEAEYLWEKFPNNLSGDSPRLLRRIFYPIGIKFQVNGCNYTLKGVQYVA